MAEGAAHAGLDEGDGVGLLDCAEQLGDGEAGREADGYGDRQEGQEGLEPDLDDQEEQKGDAERSAGEQARGAADERQETAGMRWRGGGGGRGERQEGHEGGPRNSMRLSGQGDRGAAPRGQAPHRDDLRVTGVAKASAQDGERVDLDEETLGETDVDGGAGGGRGLEPCSSKYAL